MGDLRQFDTTTEADRIWPMKSKHAKAGKPPAKRAKRATRGTSTVQKTETNRNPEFAARVERALLRAGESARRTARMYGTPLYVWEKGRVVAKRP